MVPSPGLLVHEKCAPTRSDRARMPGQPEMPVGDAVGVEALAVVLDPEAGAAVVVADVDPDLPGRGVLHDVVERLLGDAVEDLLGRQRQAVGQVALDDDRQPEPALEGRRVGLERAHEAVLLQVPGPQLEDQRPHLGEGLALQLAQLGQLLAGRVRVAVQQHLDRAGHERHREQRLRDRVVQLPGEVRALLAGGQLAGLSAKLALEPGLVADVAARTLDAGERVAVGDPDGPHVDRHHPAVGAAKDEVGLLLAIGVGDELRPAVARERHRGLVDER